jgi:hypothetical protein
MSADQEKRGGKGRGVPVGWGRGGEGVRPIFIILCELPPSSHYVTLNDPADPGIAPFPNTGENSAPPPLVTQHRLHLKG